MDRRFTKRNKDGFATRIRRWPTSDKSGPNKKRPFASHAKYSQFPRQDLEKIGTELGYELEVWRANLFRSL